MRDLKERIDLRFVHIGSINNLKSVLMTANGACLYKVLMPVIRNMTGCFASHSVALHNAIAYFVKGDDVMNIKLFQPPSKNWLVIADNLNDPSDWTRFAPCHTTTSERWQFECAVKQQATINGLSLKVCKDLLKRGVSLFEYDWNTDDDEILKHAIQVAERLNLELQLEEPTTSNAA